MKNLRMLLNLEKKKKQRSDNKFSFRVSHPQALTVCEDLTKKGLLSKYIERLILRESIILRTEEDMKRFINNCKMQIRVERSIYTHEHDKLKAKKEAVISSLQRRIEETVKTMEEKHGKK